MSARRLATPGVVGCAVACTVLLAGGAHAAVVAVDSFEDPASVFAIEGAAFIDCTAAHTGDCSVHVLPSTGASRSGATWDTTLPMSRVVVTFAFMAAAINGDMDADAIIHFDNGDVRLHLTEGSGLNTGVSLYSATQVINFTSWSAANAWNVFTLVIDRNTGTATATLAGGESATVSIPAAATRITGVGLTGINWGSGSSVYFDSFAMAATQRVTVRGGVGSGTGR